MSFKKCFMKVFTIFSWFEVWYISPLNTWKQQDLGFACFQGGKTSKFKSRKNRLKSTFSHIFFYRTYYFMMCTLPKNIPFYVLFPFMCFKQCFMKVFTIFSWFEVWYISPFNTWKQQDLDFACMQGEKCRTSNQEKS